MDVAPALLAAQAGRCPAPPPPGPAAATAKPGRTDPPSRAAGLEAKEGGAAGTLGEEEAARLTRRPLPRSRRRGFRPCRRLAEVQVQAGRAEMEGRRASPCDRRGGATRGLTMGGRRRGDGEERAERKRKEKKGDKNKKKGKKKQKIVGPTNRSQDWGTLEMGS